MELLILLKLKWDIMVPTSKDFLLILIKKLQQRKIVKNDDLEGIKTHANTFIDLILLGKSQNPIIWGLYTDDPIHFTLGESVLRGFT